MQLFGDLNILSFVRVLRLVMLIVWIVKEEKVKVVTVILREVN